MIVHTRIENALNGSETEPQTAFSGASEEMTREMMHRLAFSLVLGAALLPSSTNASTVTGPVELRVDGGASANDLLMQIQAYLLQTTVSVGEKLEAA